MFEGKSIRAVALDNGLVELCYDRQQSAINKFDIQTVNELKQAIAAIESHQGLKGLLITSAKDSFIVGADIFEFTELFAKPEPEVEAFNLSQNEAFRALEALPVPTMTVINGLALGGGFEAAMTSDYRVMAEEASVGLPEVNLGLIPGFGGTVRLSRLVGCQEAVKWIVSGKPCSAKNALASGEVDQVVPREELRRVSLELLNRAIEGAEPWQQRRENRAGQARNDLQDVAGQREKLARSRPHEPAPRLALDLIERAAALNSDMALKEEAKDFAKVAKTQSAASLVQLFINDQFLKKKAKEYASLSDRPNQAAVLGAGIMGGGIAFTSASRGTPVIMKDIAQKALDLGMEEARKLFSKQVSGGRLSQEKANTALASIKPVLEYHGFDKVDAVVEAVVENLNLKKSVLAEVEALVPDDAVLASNTSSLSITELAGVLTRPESFVGMHFFNPVPVMPLVEIIRGPRTSDAAAAKMASYAAAMGKTPILVQDCPGFLVNRLLTAYIVGFLRLIHDGVDFMEIDRVMEDFGWPMGPAYLQDVVGMDTAVHVVDIISEGYGDRMAPGFRHALTLMVENERFGQKNGKGFYRYEKDPNGRPKKERDAEAVTLLAEVQPNGPSEIPEAEIIDRTILPMIIEASRALEEGVVGSAIEVDMALILGLGFPRHLGGPLKFADWQGLDRIVAKCEHYQQKFGDLYAPTNRMREMARLGECYH